MKKLSPTMKTTLILGILMLVAALLGQPTGTGYLHAADIVVLFCAVLLPTPYALGAAGIGGALGDVLGGYYLLAPITLAIKVLMILLAKKLLNTSFGQKHPELAVCPAAFVPVGGYYLYMLVFQFIAGNGTTSFLLATGTLRKDLIQAAAGVLLFIFMYDIYMGIRSAKAAIAAEKAKEEAFNEDPESTDQILE